MGKLNIKYHPWVKNKSRGNKKYSIRVSEEGQKPFDISLDTTSLEVAEKWCELRRQEVDTYNKYVELGEEVPDSIIRKLVRQSNRGEKAVTKMTWQGAVESYVEQCAARGLRPASQDDYIKRMSAILGEDWKRTVPEITPELVRTLAARYSTKQPQTRRGYSNTFKGFLTYWMKRLGKFNMDVIDALPSVKLDRKEHSFWTMEEMNRIIEHAPSSHMAVYWRVLAETGARNNEAGLCRWEDLHGNCLRLKAEYTKGRRPRVLPLSETVLNQLSELRGDKPDSAYIFDIPTTNTQRNTALAKACELAGVKRGTLHTFRHSAAIHYFRSGKLDIKDVQTLLGHADANTTLSIYIEATSGDELADKLRSALSL